MRKRLTTRVAAAGSGHWWRCSRSPPHPPTDMTRPAEPVPPAGLTGLEPTGADMPTVGGQPRQPALLGADADHASENLNELGPAWRTHVSAVAPATDDVGQQTTPIVVDGVIYLDTPSGGVIAVDGATGRPSWKWETDRLRHCRARAAASRSGDGKVYTLAGGNRVVALDKDTGAEVWVVQPTGPGRRGPRQASTRSRPSTTTAWSTRTRPTATAAPSSR